MSAFRSVIIGNESLAVQCGEMLLDAGHTIAAVVTRNPEVRAWAEGKGLTAIEAGKGLADRLAGTTYDWLLSIANLDIIPQAVIDNAARGAINFHDGPLPRYAGLNAPVWAILNGESQHGITWHMIEGGVDEGRIVAQKLFDIAPHDTALTLNTKCYAAAIESFDDVIATAAAAELSAAPQDLSARSYFAKDQRPTAAGRLDFNADAETLAAQVRALDHGDYWNPLLCPKIEAKDQVWLVRSAKIGEGNAPSAPGTVLSQDGDELTVATSTAPLILSGLRDRFGGAADAAEIAEVGDVLPSPDTDTAAQLDAAIAGVLAKEPHWRERLETAAPYDLPLVGKPAEGGDVTERALDLPGGMTPNQAFAVLAALTARLTDQPTVDLALQIDVADAAKGYLNDWVPVRFEATEDFTTAQTTFANDIDDAIRSGGFATDLPARIPGLDGLRVPEVGLSHNAATGLVDGTALTLAASDGGATLLADSARVSDELLDLMVGRIETLAAAVATPDGQNQPVDKLPILSDRERALMLGDWNDTAAKYDANACVHQLFEAQVARTPDAVAVAFEDQSLSYSDLNEAANRAAHVLRGMGVGPGTLVGLHTRRSPALLIGALAILKAGGAYVPLDPTYPADRIALYIEDSAAPVIVTEADMVDGLPPHSADVLALDTDPRIASAEKGNPDSGVASTDVAYMIYTSGSTGRPKGVMVEHRNVSNFFTGMDDRIAHDPAGTWLAVTSLSFDISVLELFWTLARGFKLVLSNDETRTLVSGGSGTRRSGSGRGMEFSLYYWGNDDGVGSDKYKLLLEGAKFADKNGFCAVWTPERHFHAFGGPYPNPSVTGAAVAAVTENIGVRAGSCVAPLHHPARIAEEWAVIDNLTNGRAGMAIASGWQPDDFVLRPENTPPNNHAAMFQTIEDVRKLWTGEAVEFPTQSGEPFAVVTQPRPVSKQLDLWVTTAGNPETWKKAGEVGANILTHLLGQSIDEVAEKIELYHTALRDAGHDPANHKVTLMLHTFVGHDRDAVRAVVQEPMKDYLRAAAGLIKQYAWAFPAFKKPKGVSNPFQIDLGSLEPEEMEGILDFAFERYFEDSGLFGTVDDCLNRVDDLKRIGVSEVACLIDYGIPVAQVLNGLIPLAEVLRQSNEEATVDDGDYSIAAQIIRHDVSHMQCTPSMARMLTMNDESRDALARVKHMMIGGEALPGALVTELRGLTKASIENMYGPTETTIWSTTETASDGADLGDNVVNIGRPIANTSVYVLDEAGDPQPIGVPGELFIGGDGVTRGYWQRDDLTADRFVADPFIPADKAPPGGARMYRTGDLVRWRADGKIDFLGRIDHQVKLRGHRIELGEIEAAIDVHQGVRQAVVVAREDTPGVNQLVAYMTTEGPVDEAALRDRLATALPDYMMPAHFVTLDNFPLTPNKKVDRKALPAPTIRTVTAPKPSADVAAGDGSTLQKVADIWGGILGVNGIGAKDNFFELGGHSLLAVQAHREIKKTLGATKLSITDIFRFPTLGALAARIDEQSGPKAPSNVPAETTSAVNERAASRSDAMSRRREMRARRQARGS